MEKLKEYKFEKEQYFGKVHKDFVKYAKKLPRLYRLTGRRNRIYFTKESKTATPVIYNSGTTLIDNYYDKEGVKAIQKWQQDLVMKGLDPSAVLKERQDYGTILHLVYGHILMGMTFTFEDSIEVVTEIAKAAGFSQEYSSEFVQDHDKEFKKDIASFMKWLSDFEVEPIAVELMMKTDKYRTATAIDLVANITVEEKGFWGEVYKSGAKKGEPKETKQPVRKRAIIDFKSGKGQGFYPKNILQLLLNRVIWEENFPELELDGIYNFSPTDWISTPGYQFYDQERDVEAVRKMIRIQDNVFERGLVEFEDSILPKKELVMTGDIHTPAITFASMEELADMYFLESSEEDNPDKE